MLFVIRVFRCDKHGVVGHHISCVLQFVIFVCDSRTNRYLWLCCYILSSFHITPASARPQFDFIWRDLSRQQGRINLARHYFNSFTLAQLQFSRFCICLLVGLQCGGAPEHMLTLRTG